MIDVWIELWCDVKDSWMKYLHTLNLIKKKINVHFPLMITDFHFYYNSKSKHSTTKMTSRDHWKSNYKYREV